MQRLICRSVAWVCYAAIEVLAMPKKYIVYIEQVNQTFVEVTAENEEEAREKGKAKWRREWAYAKVMSVEKCHDDFQPSA